MAVVAARGVTSGAAGPSTNRGTNGDVLSGSSSASISQREDLANFISMITRDETPFMSSIGKTKATAIYHEWQTDELAPPGDSRIAEGLDYVVPTGYTGTNNPLVANSILGTSSNGLPVVDSQGTPGTAFAHTGPNRTRLGNYCQINGKTIAVSGTRRAIDQAGVADEYAYQLKKRGTELRRDLEFDLIHSYNGASSTTNRAFGGYQAWINDPDTVEYVGTATAPAADNRGEGTHVPTLATSGSLALSDMDEVMQKIYQQGGKANKIMLSPKLRRDFSDLMVTDSGVRRNLDEKGKLRQSVDVYMSDFGDLMVMPNYIMGLSYTPTAVSGTGRAAVQVRDSAALIYDSMWFSIATLRPLQEVDVGQRGDSTIGMMVEECTLEVKNPIGCGAIYGLA